MEDESYEYGDDAVQDMITDYDYHLNTDALPDIFGDDEDINDYIANLNDWD